MVHTIHKLFSMVKTMSRGGVSIGTLYEIDLNPTKFRLFHGIQRFDPKWF